MNANFVLAEQPWRAQAACRGLDPAKWYPETGERNAEAKAICNGVPGVSGSCPVRAACLEFAIAGREDFGIWGGLSERERRRLAQQRFGAMPQRARAPRPKRKAS